MHVGRYANINKGMFAMSQQLDDSRPVTGVGEHDRVFQWPEIYPLMTLLPYAAVHLQSSRCNCPASRPHPGSPINPFFRNNGPTVGARPRNAAYAAPGSRLLPLA